MASPKSRTTAGNGSGRRDKHGAHSLAFMLTTGGAALPKGATGFQIKVPDNASKVISGKPARMKTLLQEYGQAISRSRAAGRPVSFRVDVNPEGETVVTPVEETMPAAVAVPDVDDATDVELEEALSAARARGRSKAAEILSGADMLNADDFAKLLGTTRVTVNSKRQNGQILGLDGAKRGFRFPDWQLDSDGKPYAALRTLSERLGGAWAVYRFLVQSHGELDGLTGRQALAQGKTEQVLAITESIGRDFR